MINKQEIEKTKSLNEATEYLFGISSVERLCLFPGEEMAGELARQYDQLGKLHRKGTYQKIAEDFRVRTNCYSQNHPEIWPSVGIILELGCGSGLLLLELLRKTNGKIQGLDISKDMLELAKENLDNITKEEKRRLELKLGNVYDLQKLTSDKQDINYIICRNAFHRFKNPNLALEQMYSVLNQNGKIYIRDLKRDADWPTIKKRIGEQRWQSPELVKDYIGAMAQMLTTEELKEILSELRIEKYSLENGKYLIEGNNGLPIEKDQFKEFESETEYVCIIEK